MQGWGLYILALLALLPVHPAYRHWGYYEYGPSTWYLTYSKCGGERQSPINLSRKEVTFNTVFDLQYIDYETDLTGTISIKDHIIEFLPTYESNVTENLEPYVSVTSGDLQGIYYLKTVEWHSPGEHTEDTYSHELEMHMMHVNRKGDVLGIAYPVTKCRPSSFGYLPENLLDALLNLTQTGESVSFEFSPAIPIDVEMKTCGFFRYWGSITYPPCNEDVLWLVRKRGVCTTGKMIEAFANITDEQGRPLINSRPVQPLNDREVIFHSC